MTDYVWLVWLAAVLASFGVLERYALHRPQRLRTLSRVVRSLGESWPMTLVLFGAAFGALAGHFFWPLCP